MNTRMEAAVKDCTRFRMRASQARIQFGVNEASISAGTRQAAHCHAPTALAEIIAVVPVGQIAEGDSGRRISPSDLPAEARMAKRLRRVRASETTQIRLAISARDHDSECPIGRYAARR